MVFCGFSLCCLLRGMLGSSKVGEVSFLLFFVLSSQLLDSCSRIPGSWILWSWIPWTLYGAGITKLYLGLWRLRVVALRRSVVLDCWEIVIGSWMV